MVRGEVDGRGRFGGPEQAVYGLRGAEPQREVRLSAHRKVERVLFGMRLQAVARFAGFPGVAFDLLYLRVGDESSCEGAVVEPEAVLFDAVGEDSEGGVEVYDPVECVGS